MKNRVTIEKLVGDAIGVASKTSNTKMSALGIDSTQCFGDSLLLLPPGIK